MSDKRFTFEYDDGQWGVPLFYDDGKKLCFDDVVELLNEQQATIQKQEEEIKKLKKTERSWRKIHCCNKESNNCGIVIEQQATIRKLQDLCGESDSENARLRMENKILKEKLREKEEDEQLYANEIVKLNKEAKEVLDFKSLGGDY